MLQLFSALRLPAAIAAALGLAACDTFGLGGADSGVPASVASQNLEPRTDDLSGLVLALDLPRDVRPVAGGTTARFDASASGGQKSVKATLVLADGSAVDGALPPPAAGRSYVLYGFADRDKAALRSAQAWLRGLPPDAAPVTVFTVTPKLCATGSVDSAAATYSIVPALPDKSMLPLVDAGPIAAISPGGHLPPC